MDKIKVDSKFVILAILDGWGIAKKGPSNAIKMASTPNMFRFMNEYPNTTLTASGQAVGLPRNEAGNTETGHINIGAGRIIYQDLERINMAIAEGSFFKNDTLIGAINHAKENNSKLHIMGLLGAGGVHSNASHLYALLQLCNREDFRNVYIHVFSDGRDSPTMALTTYISQLKEVMKSENVGTIASVMGRYWAMDRDQRWDRTERAYKALTTGEGEKFKRAEDAINASYNKGKTDEFIEPSLITNEEGNPNALIENNDSVIFFNFRIDRPRQLTKAFVMNDFENAHTDFGFDPHRIRYEKTHVQKASQSKSNFTFERGEKLKNLYFATMTEYGHTLTEDGAKPAFPPMPVVNPLAKVISDSGAKQLHITESEKERFVTFYFNGLQENPMEGEDRIIIPSPAVPTYDLAPEMSSEMLTKTLISKMKEIEYKFAVVNFPNADMVGHTGSIGPVVRAVETVDYYLGKLADFVQYNGGTLLITADHGNAEEMINGNTGQIDTEHSGNPVPFIVINEKLFNVEVKLPEGILADVAPTTLSLLKLPQPEEMSGRNLLSELVEN